MAERSGKPETEAAEAVPGEAQSRRTVLIQAGTAAAAMLAALPLAAGAAPVYSSRSRSMETRNAPQAAAPEKLDGRAILTSLTRAGLDPKRLDLASLLGKRSDLDELNRLLHGGPAGMRKDVDWDVTFDITIFKA